MNSEYLTVREAARRLGIHENTLRNWVKRGLITATKSGRAQYQRFEADEVERLRARLDLPVAPPITKPPRRRFSVTLEMGWIKNRGGADLAVGRVRSTATHMGDKILRKAMQFDRIPCVGEGVEPASGWAIADVLRVWWSPDGMATLYLPGDGGMVYEEWATGLSGRGLGGGVRVTDRLVCNDCGPGLLERLSPDDTIIFRGVAGHSSREPGFAQKLGEKGLFLCKRGSFCAEIP